MKRKSLILVLIAVLCLFSIFTTNNLVTAATETYSVEKKTFTTVNGTLDDNISYTSGQGGGTSAPVINNGVIRLYQKGSGKTSGGFITVSAGEGCTITSVVIGSSMKTTVKYTIDSNTENSTSNSINANGKYTLSNIEATSVKFTCYGTDKNTRLYVNYLKVTYTKEVSDTPVEPEDVTNYKDTLGSLFSKYYTLDGNGVYTKDTTINVNIDGENDIKDELDNLIHAYDSTKKVELEKTTYYSGDNLWFADGHGYGKGPNNKLAGIEYVNGEVKYVYEHPTLDYMEAYYLTLHDFVEGTHSSLHVQTSEEPNRIIDLTSGWQVFENVYSNYSRDVIDAFVLFTAPTWLSLKGHSNYIDYTKVTVEEENDTLVMTLWVANGNKGLLKDQETTDEEGNYVFSQAVISNKKFVATGKKATFTFGNNKVTSTHSDGTEIKADSKNYSFTNNGYTLEFTSYSKAYTNANDIKGTSALKLGTSSVEGVVTFTVPNDVTQVVFYVAGYKSASAKVSINGVSYTINTLSDNADYTPIVIDTTTTKTITFKTLNGGYRCMVDSILFN